MTCSCLKGELASSTVAFELGPGRLHSSSPSCNNQLALDLCISVTRSSLFNLCVFQHPLPLPKERQNSSPMSLMEPPGSYHFHLPEHPVDSFMKVMITLDTNSRFSGLSESFSTEKMVGFLVFVVGLLGNKLILNWLKQPTTILEMYQSFFLMFGEIILITSFQTYVSNIHLQ